MHLTNCSYLICYYLLPISVLFAAVVVKWIVDGSHLDSAFGAILEDIAVLRSLCGDMCVQFAPRKANQVAHALAKQALKNVDDFFWLEEFPLCAAHAVQADMPV
ncbi:hypothetical protein Q3G72_031792 [Acer saccharum]|nr:hypothetical protein Q3G72_031792 [Acer saccharum]